MKLALLGLGALAAWKFFGGSSTATAGGYPGSGPADNGFDPFGFGSGSGSNVPMTPGTVATNALGVQVYAAPAEDTLPPANYFVDKKPLVLGFGGRVSQAVTTDAATRKKLDEIAKKYQVNGKSANHREGYTKNADGSGVFYLTNASPKGTIKTEKITLAAGVLPAWPRSRVVVTAPAKGFVDQAQDYVVDKAKEGLQDLAAGRSPF